MFQEAESLLCCERWPDAQQLLPLAQQHLPCVCDTRAVDDMTYYKPNTQKVREHGVECVRISSLSCLLSFHHPHPLFCANHNPGYLARSSSCRLLFWFCGLCLQVLAFLRVFVQQSLAAFHSHSPSSIAGLPEAEQQAYVVRFMREYLSQAWFDKLASTYSLAPASLSKCFSAVLLCGPCGHACRD
jgi:hypothetical protein